MPFIKGHKINVGRECKQETKDKIRVANTGRVLSLEHRKKISENTATRRPEVREKMRLSHLGKKQSPESIEKRRKANTGKKRSLEFRENARVNKLGNLNPMFGKKPSDEHRKRLSESAKRYWGPRIDKTHNELYERLRHCLEYRLWRTAVYERDNYTCIWCGDNRGGNLEADHIKPFILIMRQNQITTMERALACAELWDVINGRTLCKSCHKTTDTWGAKSR